MASVYVLNETGAQIWDLMDGQRSLSDILDALLDQYDVYPDLAETDLKEIIEDLDDSGLVRMAGNAM